MSPRRKNAIELCQERKFFIGDILVSEHWKKPRLIVAFERTAVLYKVGEVLEAMGTMPEDVHKQLGLPPEKDD